MTDFALIKEGLVQNTIVAEADFIAHIASEWDHIVPLSDGAGIGWSWDGAFMPPIVDFPEVTPAVPETCTPAQGLVALYVIKGITEADLLDAISMIPDAAARYTAQIGFSRATEWRRDSATMQQMAALLALNEADLDELFTYAVTVQV